MDYQPTEQQTEKSSANKIWYMAIIAIIIVALAFLYFSGYKMPSMENQQSPTNEEEVLPPLSGGDTTADITADLNQIPDDSAALSADASASAQEVQGF